MSAQILISDSTPVRPQTREPLQRAILPVDVAASCDYFPSDHVWWVERYRSRLYLRGKLVINRATLERELNTQRRLVKWHLDLGTERISWPGTRPERADVSDLTTHLDQRRAAGIALHQVSTELDAKLESRRDRVAERTGSYQMARRQIQQYERQTRNERPRFTSIVETFDEALTYAYRYFSRAELFRVGEHDPHYIAAAALLGYQELPDHPITWQGPDIPLSFQELDEENLAYVEQEWNVEASNPQPNGDKLAASTRKHQQILRHLIQEFRCLGYRPTYNRHVDLCVERQDDVLLVEIKSADDGNFDLQIRRALAQLLEYAYRYRGTFESKPIRALAVVEAAGTLSQLEFASDFLADNGIIFVPWGLSYPSPDWSAFPHSGTSSSTVSAIASRSST